MKNILYEPKKNKYYSKNLIKCEKFSIMIKILNDVKKMIQKKKNQWKNTIRIIKICFDNSNSKWHHRNNYMTIDRLSQRPLEKIIELGIIDRWNRKNCTKIKKS